MSVKVDEQSYPFTGFLVVQRFQSCGETPEGREVLLPRITVPVKQPHDYGYLSKNFNENIEKIDNNHPVN